MSDTTTARKYQPSDALRPDPNTAIDIQASRDLRLRAYRQARWRFFRTLRDPSFNLLAQFLRPRARTLVLVVVLNALASLVEAIRILLLLITLGLLVNETAIENGQVTLAGFSMPVPFVDQLSGSEGVAFAVAALAVITAAKEGITFLASTLAFRVQAHLLHEVREALASKLLRLELSYFSDTRSGDITYLQNTIVNRFAFLVPMLQILVAAAFDLVVALGILAWIATRLTLLLAALSLIFYLLIGRLRRRAAALSYDSEIASREAANYFHELVLGIRLIKLGGQSERAERRYLELAWDSASKTMRMFSHQALTQGLTRIGSVGVLLLAAFGLSLVADVSPSENVGVGLGFVYVAYRAMSNIVTITNARLQLASSVPHFLMVGDFLGDDSRSERQVPVGAPTDVPPPTRSLEIRDLSFAYTSRQPVLEDVSIEFPVGTATALVGLSGSGKTTLLELLSGVRTPERGAILLDGRDVREYGLDAYRRRIGYVTQDTAFFHESILENLRFLRPDAGRADVERAAELALAREFIDCTEYGFDTVIGERGLKISGGQRQRLALARVLLAEPPILLLDEATNALDVRTEAQVYGNLFRLKQGRLVIVVAHRLSSLTAFDQIVVLHHGTVIERGSHAELIARAGLYYHLHSLQQYEGDEPANGDDST